MAKQQQGTQPQDELAPKVDSSTPEAWAKTWVSEFIRLIPLYHAQGYTASALTYDMLVGCLPWEEETGIKVLDLIYKDEHYQEMLKLFEDTYRNGLLRRSMDPS